MSFTVHPASDSKRWDDFLTAQPYAPFLQSWAMGDVYSDQGQDPIRLELYEDETLRAICFAHIVPARRGRHLSVPYGPVIASQDPVEIERITEAFIASLQQSAKEHGCTFLRISPFWPLEGASPYRSIYDKWMTNRKLSDGTKFIASPMHLLGEHLWVLPLINRTAEEILAAMRKTTRNLIRRAEKDGVTVRASTDPNTEIDHFIRLHDETRQRHGFTPYTQRLFRSQMKHFSKTGHCTLYLAEYQNEVIAASIHMHFGGETSYHHGASTHRFSKIPASYLLQWTAINDAIKRGDRLYNFWGIAPPEEGIPKSQIPNPKEIPGTKSEESNSSTPTSYKLKPTSSRHPFAGVTLFKTGFGGELMNIVHCIDIPLSPWYTLTRTLELIRKKRRGF